MARLARIAAILLLGLIALGAPQKYRDLFDPANESGRVHAAMAIVDHGSVYLDVAWDDLYPGWRAGVSTMNGDAALKDGHYLLDKPPGVTLSMLPVIGLLRVLGMKPASNVLLWLLSLLFAALPSVLFLLSFRHWLHRNFEDTRSVGFVAPALVVATPWLLFGSQLAGHTYAAALVGIGAFVALGRLAPEDAGGHDRRGGFLGGLALGCAVLVEASSALLALGAVVALLADPMRRRRLPWLVLGGLGPLVVFLAWNAILFGDPLTYGYAHKATAYMAAAHGRGVLGLGPPDPGALFGLLLSAKRGLFFLAPWLLIALFGAIWGLRDRQVARAWRVLVGVGVVAVPVFLSGFSDWAGGQTVGPRYLLFTLPLFGVGAALGVRYLARSRLGRPGLAVLHGLVISSLAVLLVAQAGVPAVGVEVGNPVVEVVVPVLIEDGPIGTILDPAIGATAATALVVLAAFALLLLGAPRPTGAAPAGKAAGWTISVLVAAAAVTHLFVVATPRTEGPGAREAVLGARAYSFYYLDNRSARLATEAELTRLRKEKLRLGPTYPSRR